MTRLTPRQWARPLAIGAGAALGVASFLILTINLVQYGAVL